MSCFTDSEHLLTSYNLSDFHTATDDAPCQLGIDEAGRGPVLGPMVYAAAVSPLSLAEKLKELGVADSKQLSEAKREEIFSRVEADDGDGTRAVVAWVATVISAEEISAAMLRRAKYSLNALSHDAAIQLIDACLAARVNVTQVFVDTVGPPEAYQAKLQTRFPQLQITVSKKADQLFPIVSAASVCAKVTRDRRLYAWRFVEAPAENCPAALRMPDVPDGGFGSGYPADPATKRYMSESVERVFGYPSLVRFSWSTADTILQTKAVAVKWEDDDTDVKVPKSKSLMTYFDSGSTSAEGKENKAPVRRHAFFNDRYLTSVAQI